MRRVSRGMNKCQRSVTWQWARKAFQTHNVMQQPTTNYIGFHLRDGLGRAKSSCARVQPTTTPQLGTFMPVCDPAPAAVNPARADPAIFDYVAISDVDLDGTSIQGLVAQCSGLDVSVQALSHQPQEEWVSNLRGEHAWLARSRQLDWYTGKPPVYNVCPGVGPDGRIRSLPLPNLGHVTRKAAQDYFDNSWTLVETLFAGLKGDEPFYRPPVHGLRHPQIFYYGHTPCVYVNKLRVAGLLDRPVNDYMESVFEVGVDEMLWDDMRKNDMVWPKVAEVQAYRKQVYRVVSNLIATHPDLEDAGGSAPVEVTWDHPLWALFLGFEHERIHLETSSVLFREMPVHLVQVPAGWPGMHPSSQRASRCTMPKDPKEGTDFPANAMVPVVGGLVRLGKPRNFPSFGWDNEYGHRAVQVPPFAASKHLITNGEFWQFVASGGYRVQKYWSDDGWNWRKYRNMKWPFFWVQDGPAGSMQFRLRTIFEVADMQWDWPVNVNYHEARAYCKWKSEVDGIHGKPEAYRVITEAEHHLLRGDQAQLGLARQDFPHDRVLTAGGDQFAHTSVGAANLNLAYSSESPVDALPASTSGHHDAMGNVWEWTEDHFNGLEGFAVHPVYDDFSAPCFDGKHNMIMGGSFISTGDNGASIFSRFSFRPHFLQHCGFRVVSSSETAPAVRLDGQLGHALPAIGDRRALSRQLLLHFPGSGAAEGVPAVLEHPGAPLHALRFPQRAARLLAGLAGAGAAAQARPGSGPQPTSSLGTPGALGSLRALDLGCGVGGAAFELAALGFSEVVGLDASEAFIETAERMKRGHEVRFLVPDGGWSADVAAQHEPHVDAAARARVSFRKGSLAQLEPSLGTFDAVLVANIMYHLGDPLEHLDGLKWLVRSGGVVVVTAPSRWSDPSAQELRCPGGRRDATGSDMELKDLRRSLEAAGFVKVHEEPMPLLVRESRHSYQYIVSEATAWRR